MSQLEPPPEPTAASEPGPGTASGGPLRLEVVAERADDALVPELRAAVTRNPVARRQYPDADLWIVGTDILEKEERPDPRFRAILHDLAGNEVVEVAGFVGEPESLEVIPTSRPRLPNEEEHAWAVEALRVDPEIARRLDAGELTAYRPMPPVVSSQGADGAPERAVTVGLRETDGSSVRHRVVAVRTADGEVLEDLAELPRSDQDCGAPEGQDCAASPEGPTQARVRVWRGDELLWDLVVVRPRASSGTNGSGVELRFVNYQRVRVLYRAHVPILNVAYDGPGRLGGCGPTYRDWFNEEACFEAEGEEPVAGFRVCQSPPRTILERNEGGGGFRGVALWVDGEELLIVSQLQAGWYRYVSEWRLASDGTIRPRLGFAAVRNPCTCEPHTHHGYWRFDFDIVSADGNQVQEHNAPNVPGQLAPWHTIRYEVRRPRDPGHNRRWRARSTRSPHGYEIVPGSDDGSPDHYGAGDVWVLAFHGEEIDDGQGFSTDPVESRAALDRFVTGERVEREDVVVWYGVHFRHGPEADGDPRAARGGGHRLGPDLEPFNWRPIAERGPYIPIAPPPQEGPEDDEPLDPSGVE